MKPTMSDSELEAVLEKISNWGRWGKDDQRGALNYIDDFKRAAAARTVESGHTVSLSLPLDTVPAPDNFIPVVHLMRQTGHDGRNDAFPHSADFFTIAPHGHVNTHLDALCHIFWRGRMYNGFRRRRSHALTARSAARSTCCVAASSAAASCSTFPRCAAWNGWRTTMR